MRGSDANVNEPVLPSRPLANLTPLFGLVLVGGQSRRMGAPKWALEYHGEPQAARTARLLAGVCAHVFVSVADPDDPAARLPGVDVIPDAVSFRGPAAGIVSALAAHPDAAFLVVACDLPLLDAATLAALVDARDPARLATAFRSPRDASPEPLCAIWEPTARAGLLAGAEAGAACPRRFLMRDTPPGVLLIDAPDPAALANANTPEDRAAILADLGQQP